jgi:glycosyltransferase involved in cell wall biosynthesis
MKLLLITQKVDQNDGYFGFFHDWLLECAKQCEQLTVISLEVGTYNLPANVKVISLGKENGRSLIRYVVRFLGASWKYRKDYTHVFAHMSPLYVILGAPIWKLLGKPVGLWYIHRSVDLKLKIAEKLTDVVLTATPESFRIESTKRRFIGQAIDVEKFKNKSSESIPEQPFKMVSVGRLTQIKNLDTLIRAAKVLKDRGYAVEVELVGAAVTDKDKGFEASLHALANELGVVNEIKFVGSVPNSEVAKFYWRNHLSLNLCPTGGMDKTILESMAAGTPAMVSNEAYREYFGKHAGELIFKLRDEVDCADKIEGYIKNTGKQELKDFLLTRVKERSTLSSLIKQVISILNEAGR